MVINDKLLDNLTAQAKSSPRLRMNYDLRYSESDNSQRKLNAMEPGTVMPIHRHQKTSEIVICLRGHLRETFYDDLDRTLTFLFPSMPLQEGPAWWEVFTLLESMIPMLGLSFLPMILRARECRESMISSNTPSSFHFRK